MELQAPEKTAPDCSFRELDDVADTDLAYIQKRCNFEKILHSNLFSLTRNEDSFPVVSIKHSLF